jgi:hypothetical protein
MAAYFPVILDACVLVQACLRDTLLKPFQFGYFWRDGQMKSSLKFAGRWRTNLMERESRPTASSLNCGSISMMHGLKAMAT